MRKTAVALIALCACSLDAEVRFVDVTAQSGMRFNHNSGRAGKKYLPETMGPGCAFFDYDGDGWVDILLLNGKDWTPKGRSSLPALYRNNHNGTFTDVTRAAGLAIPMYAMGVAAADYDGDGREDLYITALEGDRLLHNEGGKFRDVTSASGIRNANFGTSAVWFDYDRDGRLDLFVANYVAWTSKGDLWCSLDGATKSYCTPESYKGTASKLYRNLGNGRFEDAGTRAGVGDPHSKSLGVAVLDYNADGWPDLFVANDTQPNKLYRNTGKGSFVDEAVAAGVAFGEDGVARGAMGVDAADYDRSGRPHLLVGNFSNQMLALYHNEGNGLFVDEAPRSPVGRDSLLSLAFGAFFFDYDLDGWLDIFAANGHIDEEIGRVQPRISYRQSPLLFRNDGKGRFVNATESVGPDIKRPIVARGAAYADYDHDGDLDVLVTDNHGPARLLRNDGGNANRWIQLALPLGTTAKIGSQWRTVHTGSSYCSQSDTTLTFGLGRENRPVAVDVTWASGKKATYTGLQPGKRYTIREGGQPR